MQNNQGKQRIEEQDLNKVNGGGVIIITTKGRKQHGGCTPNEKNSNGLQPYRCEVCGKWIEATQFWHDCE